MANDADLISELLEQRKPSPGPGGRYRRPDDRPPCTDCRLHAAQIGETAAKRYYPPLGTTIAVPTTSGGVVYLCPRHSKFGDPRKGYEGQTTTLLELGLLSRRAIRKRGLKLDV